MKSRLYQLMNEIRTIYRKQGLPLTEKLLTEQPLFILSAGNPFTHFIASVINVLI